MTANEPRFKMERVRGELPPDPNPPKRGKGRSPIYAAKLQKAVDEWPNTDWWLIAEHSERRGSDRVLDRFQRGEMDVPRGTTWEFETRTAEGGAGQLYGRLVAVGGAVD